MLIGGSVTESSPAKKVAPKSTKKMPAKKSVKK